LEFPEELWENSEFREYTIYSDIRKTAESWETAGITLKSLLIIFV